MITGTTIWGRFSSIQRADHLAATTIKHCPNNRSTRVGVAVGPMLSRWAEAWLPPASGQSTVR
jgi:hypothetical protein